ncbi:hypothetical protein D3C72_1250350 [compost metagenome]
MRVGHHIENVGAGGVVLLFVGGDAAAHVIAEGDKIDGLAQRQPVFGGDLNLNAVFAEVALHIGRIVTAGLHVTKEQPVAILALSLQHVLRSAAQRVNNTAQQHIADFAVRHDFVAGFDRPGAGHQLMMNGLVNLALAAVLCQANAGKGRMQRHIDLVKGQPVLHLVLIALEHRACVAFKKADGLAAAPAAVAFHQPIRHLVVRQRDQRLNAVLRHFVEQPVIERQPRLVRGVLIALRENPRPGDGGSQALEAHFSEQRDVLRVTMIKIDRHVLDAAVAVNPWDNRAENALRLQIRGR